MTHALQTLINNFGHNIVTALAVLAVAVLVGKMALNLYAAKTGLNRKRGGR